MLSLVVEGFFVVVVVIGKFVACLCKIRSKNQANMWFYMISRKGQDSRRPR